MSIKKENIFDLSQLVPISNDIEVKGSATILGAKKNSDGKEMSTEEIISDMEAKGYVSVPPDEWDTIPVSTYVRYMKDDGSIAKGGFIDSITHNINKDGKQIMSFHFRTSFGKIFRWIVHAHTITALWKKLSKDEIDMPTQYTINQPMINTKPHVSDTSRHVSNAPQTYSVQGGSIQNNLNNDREDFYKISKHEVDMMKEDINDNKKIIDLLKQEIQKLQNENVRIVSYLKKMNLERKR
ncbi:MAG: hypothetical protein ACRCZI_13185 [Cetobacterium sp.]